MWCTCVLLILNQLLVFPFLFSLLFFIALAWGQSLLELICCWRGNNFQSCRRISNYSGRNFIQFILFKTVLYIIFVIFLNVRQKNILPIETSVAVSAFVGSNYMLDNKITWCSCVCFHGRWCSPLMWNFYCNICIYRAWNQCETSYVWINKTC